MPGDARQNSFSGPTFASLDPRNHRIDTLINAQAHQPSASPSAFDTSSPVSLDFNFPFGGSPNDSSSGGIDAPPELRMQGHGQYSNRGSISDASRGPVPNMSQQHRHSLASIDSAFDHDLLTSGALRSWNAAHPGHPHQIVSNPDDSPKDVEEENNDPSAQKPNEQSPSGGGASLGLDQDDNKPAWSELKTKAGKERKRLPLACIACRRKKIRCSGEKPACKHCLRARVPCVYKVTTRKAAPRTDYMAMLDKRLKRMEDRVIKVIPKEELPDLSATGRASVKPPLPGSANAPNTGTPTSAGAKQKDPGSATKKRSATEAFNTELATWTGPNRRSHTVPPPSTALTASGLENKLFLEGADALPPQSLQEHLAEVYFTSLYGQSYLLLHKPSFLRKLRAGTVPPVLILAVCAISARFSTHPAVATEPAFLRGEQWATPARRICERRHYEPNITVLISMVLLGLHYFGTCEGGLSWGFGGMAMRMGYALQLHRELEREPNMRPTTSGAQGQGQGQGAGRQLQQGHVQGNGSGPQGGAGANTTTTSNAATNTNTNTSSNTNTTTTTTTTTTTSATPSKPTTPELSFTDREIRRRTMWACYLLDTFNSSGTERPSFLSEDYFSIQLPIKESHFQMEIPGPTEDLDGNVHMPRTSKTKSDPLAASAEAAALAAEAKSNMGVAAYVVRAVVLWKRIVKYLNLGGKARDPHPIWDPLSEHASLARQISALKASLPEDLRYTPENLAAHASTQLANQLLLLHIMLAQSSLFLHRFAIPTYPSSRAHHTPLLASGMPKPFLTSAAQTVIDAAAAISALLAESAGHTLTVPFAGYCAYASATVHVWGIFSRLPSLEASSKENLRVNYRYLTRMKRYWGMFHYMAESVKEAYRGFADAASRYAGNATAAGAATLLRTRSAESGTMGSVSPGLEAVSRQGTPGHTPSHSASSTGAATGKQMFQYGDWFDKYPHGVSEAEWESSHLEFRKDGAGGSEAVMSQRSELQSVEEFFASLSPPSKADEAMGGTAQGAGRNKKVARRRGKSVAESAGDATGKRGSQAAPQMQGQAGQQRASVSIPPGAQRPGLLRQPSDLTLSTNFPHATDPFDLTSPTMYRTPQVPSQSQSAADPFSATFPSPGSAHPGHGGQQFPYNFNHAVPNLDRQMVFGAYAGMDPSAITSAANASGGTTTSPGSTYPGQWDQAGMDVNGGFGGFDGMPGGFQGNVGGTAWFMPFNMEPPNYGAMGDELGGGALDGMDFNFSPDVGMGSDPGAAGEHRGSFSTQGGPGGPG
ncbi:uncharacterized protein HMPREF1541_07706 [Cyphellophora europaea CBS 101466]|uniref:Zn(2)-C6 fungal-type domain-containing protein n=1 Tax=Cyphellophora europaea (strain CBS 101466) TaxID=1220924 RepID=W2RNN7_CYPE1|nr:uncharacterized protein HMPREF1541_07706 [Cyphellophora europaea CBS 101466]ETN38082.1 hypothetical protein HMPREF1541_07706 [Cyphellophora europaea CBS 101466]